MSGYCDTPWCDAHLSGGTHSFNCPNFGTVTRYELIIRTDTDTSSGIYDTRAAAVFAAHDAAEIDGLTVVFDTTDSGQMIDNAGAEWFTFEIRKVIE